MNPPPVTNSIPDILRILAGGKDVVEVFYVVSAKDIIWAGCKIDSTNNKVVLGRKSISEEVPSEDTDFGGQERTPNNLATTLIKTC
ncbi:hypothetical protein SLA2020_017100 [Shorea laevis]